jgi:hypothetical protein
MDVRLSGEQVARRDAVELRANLDRLLTPREDKQ